MSWSWQLVKASKQFELDIDKLYGKKPPSWANCGKPVKREETNAHGYIQEIKIYLFKYFYLLIIFE